MKKHFIKLISATLVLVLSTLTFFSCGNLTEHTHGFYDTNHFHEYWWEETYSGCVDAIESLKSYDSTFKKTALVSYEGDLFDMKYCIFINKQNADKQAGLFVDRFERRIENVEIMCFAFFEDVSIDTLEHSYLEDYKAYQIIVGIEYLIEHNFNYDTLTMDSLECIEHIEHRQLIYEYRLNDDVVLYVKTFRFNDEQLSDEIVQAIIDSIDVKMYEKMKYCMGD